MKYLEKLNEVFDEWFLILIQQVWAITEQSKYKIISEQKFELLDEKQNNVLQYS